LNVKKIISPETLTIKRSFGSTFLLAVLIFPLLLGFTELFSRTLLADLVFPPSSVGSMNPEFESKLDSLNQAFKRDGSIECILLGSSQIDGGIDPAALSNAFFKKTGKAVTCYNFGILSMTAETQGALAQVLVAEYHPRLLILGTSPRDFSISYGTGVRRLLKLAWIQYVLGTYSNRGWLIEHSIAYRYYRGISNWKDPENRKAIQEQEKKIDALGYRPLPNLNQALGDIPGVLLKNYTRNQPDVDGLSKALSLNGEQTHVILLEMPVSPQFLPFYIEGGEAAFQAKFFDPIHAMAAENRVPFWSTQQYAASSLPDKDWADFRHLNKDGAKVFSAWLGDKMAAAQQQGQVPAMKSGILQP
jgi:hypothetical protein